MLYPWIKLDHLTLEVGYRDSFTDFMSNLNNLKSGVYLSVKLAAVSERLTFGEGLRVQPPGAEGMPTGTLSAK